MGVSLPAYPQGGNAVRMRSGLANCTDTSAGEYEEPTPAPHRTQPASRASYPLVFRAPIIVINVFLGKAGSPPLSGFWPPFLSCGCTATLLQPSWYRLIRSRKASYSKML